MRRGTAKSVILRSEGMARSAFPPVACSIIACLLRRPFSATLRDSEHNVLPGAPVQNVRDDDLTMAHTPEAKARKNIDAQLEACGWTVQDRKKADITASQGVAIRAFP